MDAPVRNSVFDALLRPHLDRLYRLAYRLTSCSADADDLFQDVLTKVYGRLDELSKVEDPAPWLCRIMYNQFIDERRRFARRRLVIIEEMQLIDTHANAFPEGLDPVSDAELADDIIRLQGALSALSEDHRLIVLLHDVEGYKLSEIQQITGDPLGTCKSRLHRARARLRELFGRDGTFS